jgi:hypothetical protein
VRLLGVHSDTVTVNPSASVSDAQTWDTILFLSCFVFPKSPTFTQLYFLQIKKSKDRTPSTFLPKRIHVHNASNHNAKPQHGLLATINCPRSSTREAHQTRFRVSFPQHSPGCFRHTASNKRSYPRATSTRPCKSAPPSRHTILPSRRNALSPIPLERNDDTANAA